MTTNKTNKTVDTLEAPTILTEQVEKLKLIARNSLRMELISPRLTKISETESTIILLQKQINDANHIIKVENYEISKLDTEHPDYLDKKTTKEEKIEFQTNNTKFYTEIIIEKQKEIEDQQQNISKIETGETKVSQERLNDIVKLLILESSKNQLS